MSISQHVYHRHRIYFNLSSTWIGYRILKSCWALLAITSGNLLKKMNSSLSPVAQIPALRHCLSIHVCEAGKKSVLGILLGPPFDTAATINLLSSSAPIGAMQIDALGYRTPAMEKQGSLTKCIECPWEKPTIDYVSLSRPTGRWSKRADKDGFLAYACRTGHPAGTIILSHS